MRGSFGLGHWRLFRISGFGLRAFAHLSSPAFQLSPQALDLTFADNAREANLPPHPSSPEVLAQPDRLKVDRPEGGDPVYPRGGTLNRAGAAYNR